MMYNKNFSFRRFMLIENNEFLKEKAGLIYGDLQEIQSTMKKIGVKDVVQSVKTVVNKIRGIVTGHWLKEQYPYLEVLQKVGVALENAVSKNDNLESVVNGSVDLVKKNIIDKIEGPINQLGTEPKEDQAKSEPAQNQTVTEPDISAGQPASGFDVSKNPPLGQPPEGALTV